MRTLTGSNLFHIVATSVHVGNIRRLFYDCGGRNRTISRLMSGRNSPEKKRVLSNDVTHLDPRGQNVSVVVSPGLDGGQLETVENLLVILVIGVE